MNNLVKDRIILTVKVIFQPPKLIESFPIFFLQSKMLFLLLLSSRQCFFKQCLCVWFNAKLASKIFGVFYFVLHIIA